MQSVTSSGIFVFFVLWDGWGENTVMLHEKKRVYVEVIQVNSAVKITGKTTHFVLHLPNQQILVIILLNIKCSNFL